MTAVLLNRRQRERILQELARAYFRRDHELAESIAAEYGVEFHRAEGCDHGLDGVQHIVLDCRPHRSGGDHASWYLAFFPED